MFLPSQPNATPVTHKRQLVSWLETGAKPQDRWRVATLHEKFLIDFRSHRAAEHEGARSLAAMLRNLEPLGWQPVYEMEQILGARRGEAALTLGPGGQLIFSGAPLASLSETEVELTTHLHDLSRAGRDAGLASFGLGFHPTATPQELPWMPQGRTRILRDYMPDVGREGLDLMQRSAALRVTLDYSDEADMVTKFRVALALQPLVTALFAASPFRDGKPTGESSTRTRAWLNTDPSRYNALNLVFDEGFGFESYVDWALSVPMYAIHRDGFYLDATGCFFRDFMRGELEDHPGLSATMADWSDHLASLFPPVRLRRYLELRGADMACSPAMVMALPALWTGLLYDSVALDAADQLLSEWEHEDYLALHTSAHSLRLDTPHKGRTVGEIARDLVRIASDGLQRRALGEDAYLAPLEQIIDSGVTQADDLLRRYYDEWDQNVDKALQACALS